MSRIRVLVVDDSVVVRRLVSDVLDSDGRIEVVGAAANGKVALAKIPLVNPDIVTLDVEMPVMDGLETLRELRKLYPSLPVIMFSTLTDRGASVTLDALELGAKDYVTKPANVGSVTASMEAVRDQLVPRVVALARREVSGPSTPATALVPPSAATASAPGSARDSGPVEVLAVGASTGGPDALATVLATLPASFPVPVVVVQHMPPVFTAHFAARLDRKCALSVREAADGDELRPGLVLVAPGGHHMRARRSGGQVQVHMDQGTPENYCRPAVDVLFRSVVEVYGDRVLGLVLTGMGADGARASGDIVRQGGVVYVQDQQSSVVWGMPGAVVAAGAAARVLPLADIAPALVTAVTGGRLRPNLLERTR